MSQHPEIIAAPFTVWLAPVGTAFPAVDEEPGEGWTLLGSHGARSYSSGGVTVSHDRQFAESPPPAGETAPAAASLEREGLSVNLVLLDMTVEQYAFVLGQNTVTTQPSAYLVPGVKTIGLSIEPGAAREFALLARGPSPYVGDLAAQYELPRCYEAGSPRLVFSKGQAVGISVDLKALADPAATRASERFGRLVAQFEPAGTIPPPLHFLPWAGQSLQQGNARGANHTYAQEFGIRAFPRQSTSPTAFEPAVATSESVTGTSIFGVGYPNGEMPMFGSSYLGELIAAETGQTLEQAGLALLVACNATGGTTLAQNAKGGSTGNFERVISQAAAALALAPTIDHQARCDAVFWNQGESDTGYSTYKAALSSLQASYSTDIRAVVAGAEPVKLILNQTNSIITAGSAIARAQFDAQAENANIIMSTPKYMGEYYDALHLVARDAKWIGAYDILAWYHTVILGQRWQPLHFQLESIVGTDVTLLAVANVGSLVIDETTIPAQTQTNMVRGFTCVTSGGAVVGVTAAVLVGTNRVRVTLADYAAGHRLRYACAAGVSRPSAQEDGLAAYTGGAGNIRDSLGDTIPVFRGNGVNRPMHKWAAAQEITL